MSPGRVDKHLVSFTDPASFAAEQYQGLLLKIERLRVARDVRVIAITSPHAGDGKTVTAINLAGAMARGAAGRVLLVEGDLRRPTVAKYLGIGEGGAIGLADLVVSADATLQDAVRPLEAFNLEVIPAGSSSTPAHEILKSPRLALLLQQARQRYNYVVVDTPPLMPVFDAALLAPVVDGFLIVVTASKTPRKLLEEALNLLDPSKVLGIVFNGDDRPLFGYHRAADYHQYFPAASARQP